LVFFRMGALPTATKWTFTLSEEEEIAGARTVSVAAVAAAEVDADDDCCCGCGCGCGMVTDVVDESAVVRGVDAAVASAAATDVCKDSLFIFSRTLRKLISLFH